MTKICTKCNLPKTEFYPRTDRKGRRVEHSQCKDCQRAYQITRSPIRRMRKLDRRYGLSLDGYQAMCDNQNDSCAICQQPALLHVDHNHLTGQVRSLLCGSCNRGLGMFRDDPSIVLRAANYLTTNGEQ